MRDAILAGATLNIFNNHSDRVRMANLAQTVNVLQAVLLTNEEKLLLTPTYHVMEMYNVHQDATLLPIRLQSPDYTLEQEKLPAVSASASVNASGLVHLSLVNIDARSAQEITIDLTGKKFSAVSGRILQSAKLQDFNSFDKPDRIQPRIFSEARLKDNTVTLKIPPFSVVVLELR
jgi:alpha-N-arabinofuranosidase